MQKLVAEVLTAWRSAERLVGELASDDPKLAAVRAAQDQLQATYNELTSATQVAGGQRVGAPNELEAALRETTEEIAADARRLHAIERLKARVPANDQKLVDLSLEAKELSVEIAVKTQAELKLAKEAAG